MVNFEFLKKLSVPNFGLQKPCYREVCVIERRVIERSDCTSHKQKSLYDRNSIQNKNTKVEKYIFTKSAKFRMINSPDSLRKTLSPSLNNFFNGVATEHSSGVFCLTVAALVQTPRVYRWDKGPFTNNVIKGIVLWPESFFLGMYRS